MISGDLKVSQEALNRAKTDYDDCVSRMNTLRNKLQGAVKDIRSGWQSDGGKAFFEKFDDEWLKNFNDYIAVINHMSQNMQISKNKYQKVFDEAVKLGIK